MFDKSNHRSKTFDSFVVFVVNYRFFVLCALFGFWVRCVNREWTKGSYFVASQWRNNVIEQKLAKKKSPPM